MSSVFCCRRPRTISPILGDDDDRNWTQRPRAQPSKLSRPTGSTSSRYTSRRAGDLDTLKGIFGDTSEDGTRKRQLHSRQEIPDYGEIRQQQQESQSENSASFSIIKMKIRKKLSRNLALSSTATGVDNPLETEQQVKPREELERRLQEDLLTDKGAEEGGYDVDARSIGTPVSADSILGHLEGAESRQVGISHLAKAFQRIQMSWVEPDDRQYTEAVSDTYNDEWPTPTPEESGDIYHWPPGEHPVLAAGACALVSVPKTEAPNSKIYASNAIGAHPDTNGSPLLHSPHGSRSSQVTQNSSARRTPEFVEPLPDLAETGACVPIVSEQSDPKTSKEGLEARSSFHSSHSLKMPPSPLFLPFQTQGASDSISKNVWHLSSTGIQRHSSLPRLVSNGSETPAIDELHPRPEWLDGVNNQPRLRTAPSLTHGSQCLVLNDTANGGCVGGVEDTSHIKDKPEPELILAGRGTSYIGGVSESHCRTPSESLTSTRIPRGQASQTLMPSASLPQLSRVASHRRGKANITNSPAREFRARHHRYSSGSGFGSTGIPISWGRVLKDETSSLYLSRSNSISSTTKCSVIHIPIPPIGVPRTRANTVDREAGPEPHNRDFSRGSIAAANDSGNSESKPRRHTVGSPGTLFPRFHDFELGSAPALPRVSKFMEDLRPHGAGNPSESPNIEGCSRRQAAGDYLAKYDGSQERHPSQNPEELDSKYDPERDAATVWERALRNYEYERTSVTGSSRRVSTASRGPRNSLPQRSTVLPTDLPAGSALTVPMSREGGRWRPHFWVDFSVALKRREFLDVGGSRDEHVSPGGSVAVPRGTQGIVYRSLRQSPEINAATEAGAWDRYPSHTRHLRSESADAIDRISVKDFAMTADENNQGTSITMVRGKKKSRSMTFGKGMFRRWGKQKLFRSQSMNFKRAETGHRSSIATGGYLSYPELEILPTSLLFSPQEMAPEPSRPINVDGALTPPTAVRELLVTERQLPTNAKTWSQLYEDCVAFPQDADDASFIGDMQPRMSVERQTYPRRSHPSGAQAMKRKSAVDLK
ncbi:MAG: hypothetical protein M1839_004475 [Geoglossum umbratile]|nr:MAG: hypothetical protein M1839_004475 [Geoglossum umbratile]